MSPWAGQLGLATAVKLIDPGMSPSSTATLMTTVPGDGATVTSYDKQNVYDLSDSKIGENSN